MFQFVIYKSKCYLFFLFFFFFNFWIEFFFFSAGRKSLFEFHRHELLEGKTIFSINLKFWIRLPKNQKNWYLVKITLYESTYEI